jgi:hypothetical protein
VLYVKVVTSLEENISLSPPTPAPQSLPRSPVISMLNARIKDSKNFLVRRDRVGQLVNNVERAASVRENEKG